MGDKLDHIGIRREREEAVFRFFIMALIIFFLGWMLSFFGIQVVLELALWIILISWFLDDTLGYLFRCKIKDQRSQKHKRRH